MTLSEVAWCASLLQPRRALPVIAGSLGYIRNIDRHYLLSARVLSLGLAYLGSANIESMLMRNCDALSGFR